MPLSAQGQHKKNVILVYIKSINGEGEEERP